MEQMLHEYTTQPAGRLTIYRCRHCGKGVARDTPPPDEACSKREAPPATVSGPGTELKKLLGRVGIKATANCSCNRRAREMDERGAAWCRENIDTISGWLAEQASRRGLPYSATLGKQIILLAIRAAEKAAAAQPQN